MQVWTWLDERLWRAATFQRLVKVQKKFRDTQIKREMMKQTKTWSPWEPCGCCNYQHPSSTYERRQTASPCQSMQQGRVQPGSSGSQPGVGPQHPGAHHCSCLSYRATRGSSWGLGYWVVAASGPSLKGLSGTQTAGEKVKSPRWEVSLPSCLKSGCSWFWGHAKVGIMEVQL